MVSYPDISSLPSNPTMGEFLSLPNSSFPFYWAWIIGGLWFILTSSLYFTEKLKIGRGNILSSMAVSSFGILVLSLVGTFVGFIVLELMVYSVVINVLIIALWIWSTVKS